MTSTQSFIHYSITKIEKGSPEPTAERMSKLEIIEILEKKKSIRANVISLFGVGICIPELSRFLKISNAITFSSTAFLMSPVKAPVISNMQHTHNPTSTTKARCQGQ